MWCEQHKNFSNQFANPLRRVGRVFYFLLLTWRVATFSGGSITRPLFVDRETEWGVRPCSRTVRRASLSEVEGLEVHTAKSHCVRSNFFITFFSYAHHRHCAPIAETIARQYTKGGTPMQISEFLPAGRAISHAPTLQNCEGWGRVGRISF
jgi:hypothetical protein